MKEIVQTNNINMKKQILKSTIHKEATMRKLYLTKRSCGSFLDFFIIP